MRKIISILLVAIMIFTFLTACDGGGDGGDGAQSYPESVTSNLKDGVDYTDHASTYDGEGLTYDESKWYVNKLDSVPLPDPQVFVEAGTYYIVGTSDRDGNVIDCYTTEDFVTYELHKAVYNPAEYNGWEAAKADIYAPELYCFDGIYYMYYSAKDDSGIRRNSVVVADNPLGPYEPLQKGNINGLDEPVFLDKNQNFDVLDITVFVDDDGQMYMYYSVASNENQHIVGVKLKNPYEADWSTYTKLIVPGTMDSTNSILKPLTWEMLRDGLPIAEAPYVIKSGGKYYMTYSVNGCWNKYYNVCYAVSDSPLGNYEKPFKSGESWTNLLLGYPGTNIASSPVYKQWAGFASGTAHHCFFKVGDQVMIGYHAHQNRDSNKGYTKRYFAFDYLYFDENGVPFANGPTYSIQPLPEDISGFKNVAPAATVKGQNVTNLEAINDNYIVDCYNIKGEEGKEVTLGTGYSFIELKLDRQYEIGGIAIYNSAFYDKILTEIEYIDFGNGNAIQFAQFSTDMYVNGDTEFVFPNSAFTVEIDKSIKTDRIVICVKTEQAAALNEIVILGR